jgi:hypothetical protein
MGTKDVKVTLLGAGVLEGRLLLPDPAPVRDVELHVSRVEGDRESSNRYEDRVDSDGRFRLQRILPGRVTVTVKLAKGADLAVIRDVDVPRFAAAADPRLRAIDLREHPAQRRPGTESR